MPSTLRIPRERTIQRKILSEKINQDIKDHNSKRNKIKKLLLDNGVHHSSVRKNVSLDFMLEKVRDLGLQESARQLGVDVK